MDTPALDRLEPDGASQAEAILDELAQHSLDDGYYADRPGTSSHAARVGTLAILVVFGLLLAVAAVQAGRDQVGSNEVRSAFISDISSRRKAIAQRDATLASLQAEVSELSAGSKVADYSDPAVAIASGATAVQGPGITITARSASNGKTGSVVTDEDLQLLVNGLWYAGAEAVSINGQRIGPTTAIRTAGEAITVNYRPLNEPYVVSAIGDPSSLEARWTGGPSGRYWTSRHQATGVVFSVLQVDDALTLPAVPAQRTDLRYAQVKN